MHSLTSTGWKPSFSPPKDKLRLEEALALVLLLILACAPDLLGGMGTVPRRPQAVASAKIPKLRND